MKLKPFLILLVVFASHFKSQAQDDKKWLYEHKVQSFTTMRNAGIGLTIGGTILTIVGISSMSNALAADPNLVTEEMASKYAWGAIGAGLGMTAAGGGIVLWAIGASKKNLYLHKLNSLSLNLNPAPRHLVSIAYRF
jgi:hypothetical protein